MCYSVAHLNNGLLAYNMALTCELKQLKKNKNYTKHLAYNLTCRHIQSFDLDKISAEILLTPIHDTHTLTNIAPALRSVTEVVFCRTHTTTTGEC